MNSLVQIIAALNFISNGNKPWTPKFDYYYIYSINMAKKNNEEPPKEFKKKPKHKKMEPYNRKKAWK